MNGLINVYKPKCATPLASLQAVRDVFHIPDNTKLGYAGRLDPLASGVLLAMVGDTCKQRDKFQSLDKIYSFNVLIGLHTDSLDPLGIVDDINIPKIQPGRSAIESVLSDSQGTQMQRIPLYSSYSINGSKMYKLARSGKITDSDRPVREVRILSTELSSIKYVSSDILVDKFISEITLVEGRFRQKEIIERWRSISPLLPKQLQVLYCRASVSSGTYIRALAEHIGTALNTTAIAYDIVRTSVGNYYLSHSHKP